MKRPQMSRSDRRLVTFALVAIVALVILLRVFNLGHVVMYDEAWNAHSVVDAAAGHTEDLFYSNFLRHPPLYTGLGALFVAAAGAGRSGAVMAMELISLLASVALALVIFLCGRDWFDHRVGLAAAFFFAVMPAARVYDSLAKQETLTLLFVMLFLLFFFRGRYLVSGVMLGLAMLTKEIFVFPLAALFVFILLTRRFDTLRGYFASLGIGVFLSFWWYAFVSTSSGEFVRFYLGRSEVSRNWREPWHFFAGRLPADAGWVILGLCAIGAGFLLAYVHRHGWPGGPSRAQASSDRKVRPPGSARPQWEMALFLLIWILSLYAFISFSVGKSPWLMYSALPAFALLAGWGLRETVRLLAPHPALGRALVVAALAGALALSLPVGFYSFMKGADRTYEKSLAYKEVADYLNQRMPQSGRTILRINDLGPNLLFYLNSYRPDSVYVLDEEPASTEEGLDAGYTVLVVPTGADAASLFTHATFTRSDFLAVRPGFSSADGSDPALEFASVSRPVEIDGVWVFDWRELARAAGQPANP